MSTVLVLTPVIIGSWPAITAAVAGAAAALGFVTKQAVKEMVNDPLQDVEVQQEVEVELEQSEVVATHMKAGQEIVLNKGNVEIRVRRDQRGRCVVCATGKGLTKAELTQIAEEFAQKVTQCFVYDKVMRELKAKNFNLVNEEVMADQSIRIHVRRFVE
jgi:hypothetical protein